MIAGPTITIAPLEGTPLPTQPPTGSTPVVKPAILPAVSPITSTPVELQPLSEQPIETAPVAAPIETAPLEPTPAAIVLAEAQRTIIQQLQQMTQQETVTLENIQQLVQKTSHLEQTEAELNHHLQAIHHYQSLLRTQPDAQLPAEELDWLNTYLPNTTDRSQDNQASAPSVTSQIVTMQPAEHLTTPTVLAQQPSTTVVTPEKPLATYEQPSPAEHHIIETVKPTQPAERQALFTPASRVYQSPNGNGVIVCTGKDIVHLSDAELIQAGLFADDVAGIQPPPSSVLEHFNVMNQ
jgi:hypothetical protein